MLNSCFPFEMRSALFRALPVPLPPQ
ncbi:unnamed protein product [Nezara viridula]|uniref:Uncharacterized protein n=1 Tax=Nezara viridula TaxID=85310 RepID=A0A9P0HFF7_NEZVI|nr:unnamed protein product [Nezara viridula]